MDYACFPDDKLLTTLCGKQRNLTISSQSNSLVLVFTSDYFQEGRGFKIYARSRNANSSNRPRGHGNITKNKCSIEHHTWINCYHVIIYNSFSARTYIIDCILCILFVFEHWMLIFGYRRSYSTQGLADKLSYRTLALVISVLYRQYRK